MQFITDEGALMFCCGSFFVVSLPNQENQSMKKTICLLTIAIITLSCNRNQGPERAQKDIFATIESIGTKTYLSDGSSVLWSRGDSLSIFYKDNYNSPALYTGNGGENQGQFRILSSSRKANPADHVYGVYPYSRSVSLGSDGSIGLWFPTVQYYERDSFGDSASPMAAISDNENLKFRHIGSFVRLRVYGKGIKVALVEIDSNLEEPLSGAGSVRFNRDGIPEFSFGRTADTKSFVYMDCIANPVPLGQDEDHVTEFTLVLPPVNLNNGFTAYVVDENDREFAIQVASPLQLERNRRVNVNPVEISFPEAGRDDIDAYLTGTYTFNSTSYYASEGLGPYSDEIRISPSDDPKDGQVTLQGNLAISEDIKLGGDFDLTGMKLVLPAGQILSGFYTDDTKTKVCWLKLYLCDDEYYYSEDIPFAVKGPRQLEFAYASQGLDLLFLGFIDNQIDGAYERIRIKSIEYKPSKGVAALASARGYDVNRGLKRNFHSRAGRLMGMKPAGKMSDLVQKR